MIKRIEHWALNRVYPTFDDRESLTAIELIGKNTTKINEIIETVNEFIDEVNKEIEEFITTSNTNYETFKVSMEQKFQDFIDVIELKCKSQDARIESGLEEVKQLALDYVSRELPVIVGDQLAEIENRVSVLEHTEYTLEYDTDGEGIILVKTVSEVNE